VKKSCRRQLTLAIIAALLIALAVLVEKTK
jgi:hypothetical protein